MGKAQGKARIYATFAIVTLTCSFGSLSQTSTNSMMLGIQADFGTSESILQWLTTIYMLVMGVTVPLVSHLSKKVGIKTLMVVALCSFLVGLCIDFFAVNFIMLFLGRIPQAIAAGITLPLINYIAMTRFPKGQNGTAMGIAGIAMGFAPNIGPLVGGALVDSLGWRSFFLILSVAIFALLLATIWTIPKDDGLDTSVHLDSTSFMLSTLGFGGILLGLTDAASFGIFRWEVWVPLLIGVACLILFVRRQKRVTYPLINLDIFKTSDFLVSFIGQNFLFASFMGITLIIPLFVQNVQGLSALDSGIVFLPPTIMALIINPLGGFLSDKIGVRPVTMCSSVLMLLGAAPLAFINADTPLWLITVLQTIRGIGVGSTIGPLAAWGMAKLDKSLMIDGAAFSANVRQACASFGTAIMMLFISLVGPTAGAFGYQLALGFSAFLGLCMLVIIFVRVGKEECSR